MAEGTLLVSCCCPHLCPQSNSAQQPEPAYENVSRTRSLPCSHSPLAPPHSESRPEPYREHWGPWPKALLPRCPPRSLPHLLPGSPPTFQEKLTPTCTPTLFIFSTALSPSNLLTHLLMLCPLREGRDFCRFCTLMAPRLIVRILTLGTMRAGCRPCQGFPGEYQSWM